MLLNFNLNVGFFDEIFDFDLERYLLLRLFL